MADQTELDLLAPPAPRPALPKRKPGFGGFSRTQIFAGVALIALTVWGMWVTRVLTTPRQEHIVSARLSALVGDYVEAQRFSGSPPDRVRAEMAAFMSSLDKELQRRSAAGQVVLVGEAVLTKNVPDITDNLKKAVFASGVPEPKRLSVDELQRMQELSASQAAIAAAGQAPVSAAGRIDPMGTTPAFGAQVPMPASDPSMQPPARAAGASVSTFGGPDGNGSQ